MNLAARIADRAAAGQVLVSERVAQTVSSQDVIFVEHGELRLKGIAAPVRVLEARRL
jgi:class 3 adenylate cyclase